jgi:hypothetical protein
MGHRFRREAQAGTNRWTTGASVMAGRNVALTFMVVILDLPGVRVNVSADSVDKNIETDARWVGHRSSELVSVLKRCIWTGQEPISGLESG